MDCPLEASRHSSPDPQPPSQEELKALHKICQTSKPPHPIESRLLEVRGVHEELEALHKICQTTKPPHPTESWLLEVRGVHEAECSVMLQSKPIR